MKKKTLNDIEIDVGLEILGARIDADLTQSALAKKLGTKQPSVARVERGRVLASIPFLQRIARATNSSLILKLIHNDPRFVSTGTVTTESSVSF